MTKKEKFFLKWTVAFLVLGIVLPLVLTLLIDDGAVIMIQMLVVLFMMVILLGKAVAANRPTDNQ